MMVTRGQGEWELWETEMQPEFREREGERIKMKRESAKAHSKVC